MLDLHDPGDSNLFNLETTSSIFLQFFPSILPYMLLLRTEYIDECTSNCHDTCQFFSVHCFKFRKFVVKMHLPISPVSFFLYHYNYKVVITTAVNSTIASGCPALLPSIMSNTDMFFQNITVASLSPYSVKPTSKSKAAITTIITKVIVQF